MKVVPAGMMKLMDLVSFGNFTNKAGGKLSMTGEHQIKNLKNEKKGQVSLNDHKDGQKTKIGNFINEGNAAMSGKHEIANTQNKGNISVTPRKFKDKKMILMDLATFNNMSNQNGGNL